MTTAPVSLRSSAARASDAPIVAAQGLTKVFKDFWLRSRVRAVDDLDLEIRPHEVFGLLGPNGSGKSTSIKMILGLLHKTGGRLAVFGKHPTDVSIKKRIGVLPEESYLYPFLNARETLDYYAKLFELDHRARKRRIDELLDMVGLDTVQHRQIKEYSKGMQRRIGLAQALINDPEFLILDEPTSGLDPIGTRQVKDLIIELGNRGKTILLSSHQLSDVEDCVHRMAILYGGKKRAEGTVEELLVARDRLTIETEELDEQTISEIDALIRARTGRAISRVARPRQKLEELFVDIVEQARKERIETHGAGAGGATASFLLEEQGGEDQADQLIDRLVSGAEETPFPVASTREPAQAPPEAAESEPDESLIENLIEEEPAPEQPAPKPETRAASPARPRPVSPDVDESLIGSLLDPEADDSNETRSRGGGDKP
ncbi:MAG: ATP-binding cassette domain-containing protein [Planctomycetota bacterium]|nr:ATP-binding cassette domain-containing protein [Planctomycetota bacterium]